MANTKISALTSATTPLAGTEVLPIVQSSATVKVAVSDLTAGRSISVAGLTNTALTASRPVFTDASKVLTSTGVVPVANGGTNVSAASITAFNNITGYTAAGATGTTSTNLVFSTSPSITTPTLVGDVSVSTGNIVIGTSGKGIDFSATSHLAGMTSELLADYEEGTWTPNQGSGLTVTGAFSSSGNYTKIGRVVTVYGRLAGATSISSSASGILTTNMPYAGLIIATGTAGNSNINSGSIVELSDNTLYSITAIGGGASTIFFTITYPV